jgi:hypothetical protein
MLIIALLETISVCDAVWINFEAKHDENKKRPVFGYVCKSH